MSRFTGKTVLISGAARGQGESHARAYVAEGANVVVTDIRDELGEKVVADLGEHAIYVHLDVTSADDWAAAVSAAEDRFGPIDVLVNNAGVPSPAVLIENSDEADWQHILAVNLTGQYLGIRAAAPSLRRAGGGAIVNIASIAADRGLPFLAPYVASKWGVEGLTKTAALELARDGVRVNSIHPGVVRTPFVLEPVRPEEPAVADAFPADAFAVQRLAEPQEITKLLLHLTSDDASFITGTAVVADGGFLLGAVPA